MGRADDDDDRMIEQTLHFSPERVMLAHALGDLLSFYPHCPRCLHGLGEPIDRSRVRFFAHPVTHVDGEGSTCYEHAGLGAKPVEGWRSIMFAHVVASAFNGGAEVSEAGQQAAWEARCQVRAGRTTREGFAFDAALRFYAGRRGDDEHAESYASGIKQKALIAGLMAYAAASGDPTIRPAWVVAGFDLWCRFRWPGDDAPAAGVHRQRRRDADVGLMTLADVAEETAGWDQQNVAALLRHLGGRQDALAPFPSIAAAVEGAAAREVREADDLARRGMLGPPCPECRSIRTEAVAPHASDALGQSHLCRACGHAWTPAPSRRRPPPAGA